MEGICIFCIFVDTVLLNFKFPAKTRTLSVKFYEKLFVCQLSGIDVVSMSRKFKFLRLKIDSTGGRSSTIELKSIQRNTRGREIFEIQQPRFNPLISFNFPARHSSPRCTSKFQFARYATHVNVLTPFKSLAQRSFRMSNLTKELVVFDTLTSEIVTIFFLSFFFRLLSSIDRLSGGAKFHKFNFE